MIPERIPSYGTRFLIVEHGYYNKGLVFSKTM